MCKITTVSPSLFIDHSHTSAYRVNHSVFLFLKALSRCFVAPEQNNRHQCQSDWPTDERRAPKKKIGVSFARAHIESQGNHLPIVATKLPKGGEASSTFWTRHNKEAHKWTEGTPSFWRRHNMFKLWQMSKDSDRPTQTQKETQGALPTHSHTISPSTSLSSKVTARPCWEKGSFVVTIPEQESCSGTVKTAKEVSSANLSSLNTHPSYLGIKCPLPCGSLMPPVLAPNPPRKETPLHLTNLPNDFKSEVIDVVLVIFKRRRAFTSCPLIANAAPNCVFFGQHTSTYLSA